MVYFVCAGNVMRIEKVLEQFFDSRVYYLITDFIVTMIPIERIVKILMTIPRAPILETSSTNIAFIWLFIGAANQGQFEVTHY